MFPAPHWALPAAEDLNTKNWIRTLRQVPGLKQLEEQIWKVRFAWSRTMGRLFVNQLVHEMKRTGRGRSLEELFALSQKGFLGTIFPVQMRSEIVPLLELLRAESPRRILEIGTATGGTLFLFSRVAADQATLVSIDLPGGAGGGGYPEWKVPLYQAFALPGQRIELIRGDSHEESNLARAKQLFNDEPVDFLFIDGDHSYEGVKKDFEMYAPLVRAGGVIAFHDIVYCEPVETFWNELKARGLDCREFINVDGKALGIGVIRLAR